MISKSPGCVPFWSQSDTIWAQISLACNPLLCSPEYSCGGNFLGPKGVITSPNYPENYDTHATCVYVINVDLNFLVQLIFEDFQTEECQNFCDGVKVRSSSDNCMGVRFGSKLKLVQIRDLLRSDFSTLK